MSTIEQLQRKAESSFHDKVRMPSISKIAEMLDENEIEYRLYPNWDKGCKLEIDLSGNESAVIGNYCITLNSAEPYYSYNNWQYAKDILELLKLRGKLQ